MNHHRSTTQRSRTVRFREDAATRTASDQMLTLLGNIRTLEDQLIAEQYRHSLLIEENQHYRVTLEELDSECKTQKITISELEVETEARKAKNHELQTCEESLREIYMQLDQLTSAAEKRSGECELLTLERDQLREENDVLAQSNLEIRSRIDQFGSVLGPFLGVSERTEALQLLEIARTRIRADREALMELQASQIQLRKDQSIALSMQRQLILKMEYQQRLLIQRQHDANKIKELNNMNQGQGQLQGIVEEMLLKEDQLNEELRMLQKQNQRIRQQQQTKIKSIQYEASKDTEKENNQIGQLRLEVDRLRAQIKKWQSMIESKSSMCSQVIEEFEYKSKVDLNLEAMRRLRECQERNKHLRRKIDEARQGARFAREEQALMRGDGMVRRVVVETIQSSDR